MSCMEQASNMQWPCYITTHAYPETSSAPAGEAPVPLRVLLHDLIISHSASSLKTVILGTKLPAHDPLGVNHIQTIIASSGYLMNIIFSTSLNMLESNMVPSSLLFRIYDP